jgi:hypothetical protein
MRNLTTSQIKTIIGKFRDAVAAANSASDTYNRFLKSKRLKKLWGKIDHDTALRRRYAALGELDKLKGRVLELFAREGVDASAVFEFFYNAKEFRVWEDSWDPLKSYPCFAALQNLELQLSKTPPDSSFPLTANGQWVWPLRGSSLMKIYGKNNMRAVRSLLGDDLRNVNGNRQQWRIWIVNGDNSERAEKLKKAAEFKY